MALEDIVHFFSQIEGPYKWYVIAGFVFFLSAILSKIALKTIKWFIIVVCLAIIGAALLHYWPIGQS
jgi:hypothetical protein